ncbi:hypothetical protein PGTUg99_013661 [Puccinia graminis f. sp. tritici]|uniref:Uncharacterized protein n=1 Tax=Puccinia graminis f. sp. tritici TaxID=56615 RepID=A0A5B0Q3V0_PUCGR|nr:hypothetical protein PGTUg99_013661 [Puccinia graminis f. sp. tritici]
MLTQHCHQTRLAVQDEEILQWISEAFNLSVQTPWRCPQSSCQLCPQSTDLRRSLYRSATHPERVSGNSAPKLNHLCNPLAPATLLNPLPEVDLLTQLGSNLSIKKQKKSSS